MDTEVSPRKIPIDRLTLESLKSGFIALDLTTTGLDPFKDRIVEIGAVRFVHGQAKEAFSTRVRPDAPISFPATQLKGLTGEMVADTPGEAEAISKFIAFIGNALFGKTVMCAHNASFNFNFLRRAFTSFGIRSKIVYVDTMAASKAAIAGLENYKLETVQNYLKLNNPKPHRAQINALCCGEILCKLLPLLETQDLSFDENGRIGRPNRPGKGRQLMDCPKNYCIVSIETTGRSLTWDRITEVAALKFQNGAYTDSFSASIPDDSTARNVWRRFLRFIENFVLVGHSAHFDIDFLYDSVQRRLHLTLTNDYIDTYDLARLLLPHLTHHGLYALADYYNCKPITFYGASSKCQLTAQCYANLVEDIKRMYGNVAAFRRTFQRKEPQDR